MKLSEHFYLSEFVFSEVALRLTIDNEPSKDIINELKKTAAMMEKVRALLGSVPVFVSSGYRSEALNQAIGGSTKSQHCKGQACDFVCHGYGTPREISIKIAESDIYFDQLIYEGKWVHISQSEKNRRQVMTALFANRSVSYVAGIA